MSDFQIVRLKGGYRLHRKVPGEPSAICGAKPRTVVTGARCMKIRAGWWVYAVDPTDPRSRFDMRCKTCFQVPVELTQA